MKETLKGLSVSSQMENSYVSPAVTIVTIYSEGVLCQSGGILGADHGGFAEDNGNPEDLW